jgi:hypothetical protein
MTDTEPIEAEVVESESQTNNKNKKRSMVKHEPQQTALAPAPGSIEDLMIRAVEKGDMDLIERIFALNEKVKIERKEKAFLAALSRFQSIVPKIPKTKKGYGYWYSDLGTIESKIAKAMEASGLSKRWRQDETPDSIKMYCVVSHSEGHSEETPIGPVPWDLLEKTERMNGLQHRSSVITYLQRYTLIGALGLATADDDPDGVIPEDARIEAEKQRRQPVSQPQPKPSVQKKAAAKPTATGERLPLQPAPEGEAIESSTIKVLTSKMEHAALSNGDFKKRFGLDGVEQINRKNINEVLAWIIDPRNA